MLLLIPGLLLKPILLLIQRLLLIGQSAPNSKSSTNFCLAPKYRFAFATNLVAAPNHHAATSANSAKNSLFMSVFRFIEPRVLVSVCTLNITLLR